MCGKVIKPSSANEVLSLIELVICVQRILFEFILRRNSMAYILCRGVFSFRIYSKLAPNPSSCAIPTGYFLFLLRHAILTTSFCDLKRFSQAKPLSVTWMCVTSPMSDIYCILDTCCAYIKDFEHCNAGGRADMNAKMYTCELTIQK